MAAATNRLSGKSVAGTSSASALPDSVHQCAHPHRIFRKTDSLQKEEEKMQEDAKDDFILSASEEQAKEQTANKKKKIIM